LAAIRRTLSSVDQLPRQSDGSGLFEGGPGGLDEVGAGLDAGELGGLDEAVEDRGDLGTWLRA
jgi:hypothetical protein